MHILHVIPGLDIGGAETMLLQAVRALAAPQYAHTIVNMQANGALTQALEAAGAKVVHLGMRRSRPSLPGVLRLAYEARQARPDVVQGWMYHGNLGASAAALASGTKPALVWSVHMHASDAIEAPATRAVARLNAALSSKPDAVVYVARAAIDAHVRAGFDEPNAVYIPGGVDTQAFAPDPDARVRLRAALGVADDTPLVAIVARFHPTKDHANFLQAAQRLTDASMFTGRAPHAASAHFVIVGAGLDVLPDALSAHAPQHLQSRLHWLGARSDVASILQGCDVCTLSSAYSEALPRVLLEAMACETACVATDLGDCAALLCDVGWVAPPRDPDALATAWVQALTCPSEARAARLQRGRARVERDHSLTQMQRAFGELYARLRTR